MPKNSLIFKIIKKIIDTFFWNQHPEAALRYLPVVKFLKQSNLAQSKILEIGPGSTGVVPYLKRKIDGIDIDFSGPQTDLLHKIKGSVVKLPVRKNSYDVVISVDVLEHLKKEQREEAVCEILRVAKKLAIIIVPVGELSEKQDQNLYNIWRKNFSAKNQFLEEHVTFGLPKTDEVLVQFDRSLKKLKKEAKITSQPLLNIKVRYLLMRTWVSKNRFFYYLYLKGYLLLVPILKFANFGNCYRRFFVIEFTPKGQ